MHDFVGGLIAPTTTSSRDQSLIAAVWSQHVQTIDLHRCARAYMDPRCFSGSGPTHFFRRWVRIGIGPTHFLRWIVYYCVCIQHDTDKSQISFIELCKTLRMNSGLRAINSCLHLFWRQLCNRNICAVSCVYACVWLALSTHFTSRLWSLDPPTFLHRSTPLWMRMPILEAISQHCRLPRMQQREMKIQSDLSKF